MEGFAIFFLLGCIALVIIFPIAALVRASRALREIAELRGKVAELNALLAGSQPSARREEMPKSSLTPLAAAKVAAGTAASEVQTPEFEEMSAAPAPRAVVPSPPPLEEAATTAPKPPPLPVPVEFTAPPMSVAKEESAEPPFSPPPIPARKLQKPVLSVEQFMGVKLFAWLGGLALFFGIVFFVKYAVEHAWISPATRASIGYLVGSGLLVVGVRVYRKKTYTVLAETFLGTGVLILYGVTYAAFAYWKLFSSPLAFGFMALVTATAFLLSVRLHTLTVSVLGLVGGFLTPILCSTGEDHPYALFGYVALLDIGLLAIARVKKWYFLASLGAAGTMLMELGWLGRFFAAEQYDQGSATWTPILIGVGFIGLFLVAAMRIRRTETGNLHPVLSVMALCASAMLIAFYFLEFPQVVSRTWVLYTFVFLINAGVIAGVIIDPRWAPAQLMVGLATFIHLAAWTMQSLRPETLNSALAVYFIFGALHSCLPMLWQRLHPANTTRFHSAFGPWFPPLTLVLMLLPILHLPETSFAIWPAILLVDLLAIVAAVTTSILLPVVFALLLTLFAAAFWLFKLPVASNSLDSFLVVVGGFAAFFALAGFWLTKRSRSGAQEATGSPQVAAMLPVMSAGLPFALLIMATQRLPMDSPTPVFGLGLLLVLLQLGLAKISRLFVLTLVSLGCIFALEISWLEAHFRPGAPWTPLIWYIAVYALFAAYPFVFRRSFRETLLPWATAALAGILQFLLIHNLVRDAFPAMAGVLGLVPASFIIPSALSLLAVAQELDSAAKVRQGQLAWFGGVTLLFITLIFPIQFRHQWLTLSWALEGAALLWLFRRVPHVGLRSTGLALLAVAFVRLAFNPAVLEYHAHSPQLILNWYLYSYSIVALAMFQGARWLEEPCPRLAGLSVRNLLWTAGGVLLFWLLNIEIADYFTAPDASYTVIEFVNINLARDMTYSIAWAIFALALILLGFLFNAKGARYAGIGLMAGTLLKVFLHDLASLESIYRIAALIGVAVVALAASFLYQRFFEKTKLGEKP